MTQVLFDITVVARVTNMRDTINPSTHWRYLETFIWQTVRQLRFKKNSEGRSNTDVLAGCSLERKQSLWHNETMLLDFRSETHHNFWCDLDTSQECFTFSQSPQKYKDEDVQGSFRITRLVLIIFFGANNLSQHISSLGEYRFITEQTLWYMYVASEMPWSDKDLTLICWMVVDQRTDRHVTERMSVTLLTYALQWSKHSWKLSTHSDETLTNHTGYIVVKPLWWIRLPSLTSVGVQHNKYYRSTVMNNHIHSCITFTGTARCDGHFMRNTLYIVYIPCNCR